MRHIIQTATAILLLTANMQGLYAKTFLPPEEVKTIKVGDTKVTWLQDNGSKQRAAIFPGVPQSLLDSLGVADGIPSSMSAFLVEREGKQILFDTGLGKVGSRLLPLLESLGIKPEDIKYLYLTHFHGDHIGGMLDGDKVVFPNAEVYASKKEYEAWMNMPPEKVNVITGAANQAGSPGFGACLLEMLSGSKTADFIRTVIASEPIIGENYYRSVLMLYGAGFDEGLYRFDRDGRLEISQAAQKLTLERAAADARAKKEAMTQEQKQKEAKQAEGESAASESKEASAAQSAAADQKEPAAEPAPDAAAKGSAGASAPKPEAAAQKPQPAESANGGNAK